MRPLSVSEGVLFECLTNSLPEGWVVRFETNPELEWVALVYQAMDRRTMPQFTVCRWCDHLGLFVRWMDGTATTIILTELCPILNIISNSVFDMKGAELATVPIGNWTDVKH